MRTDGEEDNSAASSEDQALPFGKLPAKEETIDFSSDDDDDSETCDDEKQESNENSNEASENGTEESSLSTSQRTEEELNEMYKALEQMRRFNLEVACQEAAISPKEIDYDACSHCLLEGSLAEQQESLSNKMSSYLQAEKVPENMPRLKKFVQRRKEQSKPKRCLTCGAPCCSNHSSQTFRESGITVCKDCDAMFSLEFLVDDLTKKKKESDSNDDDKTNDETRETDHPERKELMVRMNQLISLYDRVLLLLKFSRQYMDQMIVGLEESKSLSDKINVGGSSVGVVSGILGIAAAATLVTPAGVPLLVASLMLGTGATAAQTGTEVNEKYFSEPNQFANRVLALHGIAVRLLSNVCVLRDIVHADYLRLGKDDANNGDAFSRTMSLPQNLTESKALAGVTTGRLVAGSAELFVPEGVAVARGARQFSRVGTGTMRSLRFARFAGGVLSAATIVLEASTMATTVQAIQEGSPCEKAEALKKIQRDIPHFATSSDLDEELCSYVLYIQERGFEREELSKLIFQASNGTVGIDSEADNEEKEYADNEETEQSESAPQTRRLFDGSLLKRAQETIGQSFQKEDESDTDLKLGNKAVARGDLSSSQEEQETRRTSSNRIFSGALASRVREMSEQMTKPKEKEVDDSTAPPASVFTAGRFSEWAASDSKDAAKSASSSSTSSFSDRWNGRPRLFGSVSAASTAATNGDVQSRPDGDVVEQVDTSTERKSLTDRWQNRPRLLNQSTSSSSSQTSSPSLSQRWKDRPRLFAPTGESNVVAPAERGSTVIEEGTATSTTSNSEVRSTADQSPQLELKEREDLELAMALSLSQQQSPVEEAVQQTPSTPERDETLSPTTESPQRQPLNTAVESLEENKENGDENDSQGSWDVVDEDDGLGRATLNVGSTLFESAIQE